MKMIDRKINLWVQTVILIGVALTNYQLAKLIQRTWLSLDPGFSYTIAIVLPWLGVGLTLLLTSGFYRSLMWQMSMITASWKLLVFYFGLLSLGLTIFVQLGITHYFHGVKSPIIFFLFTPLIEEVIFRGWVYEKVEQIYKWPAITSAALFAIHHLQYFDYQPTFFAIFQIVYTFGLGVILGDMRRTSGSIYLPLFAHILLNWATLQW